MNDKIDYRPAIDRAAELLDCLPGQVPERVAMLIERLKTSPGDHPPSDTRDVLCYDCDGFHLGFYAHELQQWYFYIPGEGSEPCPEIYYWWELPVMAKEKK